MTACTSSQMVAGPNVSIYTEIPLAPNVVLTVETPMIASPGPDYVWVDGYWTWDYRYREYVWAQGYWALAPYAGAFWIPGYWEYYRSGYRWIDACWLPRNHQFAYGYYNGRYDYYGRPVYYDRPRNNVRRGYAYTYDNRPEYRSKGYSSSPRFNDAPKNERTRITREYQQQTRNSTQPANTDRNRQETIRIRESNTQRSKESSTQRQSNPEGSRTPATTTPSRTQPDNNRQNSGTVRSNESRSSNENGSNASRSSSSGESRVRESNSSSNQSQSQSRSSGSSSSSRSSSSGAGRR
ncbi:hypothetical protein AGMMS50239_08120 [Bacteroidia bacterium]|nr:hypothetical protein AGMMS50239_08120 [Bacteroidia bacterium]